MTWLDRILATPCQLPSCRAKAGDACDVERGMRPVRPADPSYFHASRIQAAEGAEREAAKRGAPHRNSHIDRGIGPWMRIIWTCERCPTWVTYDGRRRRYSTDNGTTWTPGPSVCPGRRP